VRFQALALSITSDSVWWLQGFAIACLLIAAWWTGFWIWMLIDCARSTTLELVPKIVWLLVILILQPIGAGMYFVFARDPPSAGAGS